MNSAEAGILQDSDQVGFSSLLDGNEGLSLESKVIVDSTAYLTDKTVEWCSWDQQISRFLVSFDLTEGDRARLEPHLSTLHLGSGG